MAAVAVAEEVGKVPMAYVYILECADGTYYTGSTTDIERRFHEHAYTARAARYTRGRRPLKVVYSASFPTIQAARSNEAVIKKLSKAQKAKLISMK